MAEAFSLQIPLEPAYRDLVPEVAGRYAELLGGSAADAAALSDAVVAAMAKVTAGAEPSTDEIDLRFKPNGAGVHVELSCRDRRTSVTVPISVAKTS
jgi:hypothetical protein